MLFLALNAGKCFQPYRLLLLAHLRLGYEQVRWTTELWVRNVLDERYGVRGFYFGNEPPDFPPVNYRRLGDPRHVGVTLAVDF